MDIERPERYAKKQRQRRILYSVAGVIVVALFVYVFTLASPLPRVERNEIWLGEVKRGDMLRNVRGLGRLIPADMRWITSQTSGRVEEKFVKSGALVQPDTIILQLSNPQLEQQYQNAKLELEAAEAELISTRVRLQSDLLSMKSNYTRLKEQTEMAELEEEINDQLFEDGLVSELNRKRSKLSAQHLRSRLAMETERLNFQEQAIEPQLATQKTYVDRAQARLDLLQTQVDALKVRAGSNGVVQQLDLEQGMQVAEGQQIALVSDPQNLDAMLEIQESQAREVRIGQRAEIDTRTSGIVQASVTRIDPNVERGIVRVDLEFTDSLPEGCRADQTVQGNIELQRLDDVIYVDRPSTVKENTKASVFVMSADEKQALRTPVEFGRSSVTLVEIVSGLRPGQQIILSDSSRWQSSEAIEIR
ncbi:MAG: efflux RND transporter periplasmic adaptor subunit [Opitutales bacterium]|nr:efflux RND transporter periplasmic adaptor subunit [Opitutales bacterium]